MQRARLTRQVLGCLLILLAAPGGLAPAQDKPRESQVRTAQLIAQWRASQGRLAEAAQELEKALGLGRKVYGPDHVKVAGLMDELVVVYLKLERAVPAEPLCREAFRIYEAKLGKRHPTTANTLNNLAAVYKFQGRSDLAEPLHRQALAILEEKLGKEDPAIGINLVNLASLLAGQGRGAESEPLFRRAVAILEKSGKVGYELGAALNNLGALRMNQGQYAEARRYYERALAVWEKTLGKDHPEAAATLTNLAAVCRETGHAADAEPLLQRALKIFEARFGKRHPRTAEALQGLGLLYEIQGRFAESEGHLERAREIVEASSGRRHPHLAETFHALVKIHGARARWADAVQAMEGARKVLHSHVGHVLVSLPEARQLEFLRAKATPSFQLALALGLRLKENGTARRRSAEWLLNGRGRTQQALAEQALLQRDARAADTAKRVGELQAVRRELAALTLRIPRPGPAEAQRRRLDELAAREEELARRLAQETGRPERSSRWAGLAEVQKALPADAALVEIVRTRHLKFDVRGWTDAWGPVHYAAWVIDAAGVAVVDLGEALAVDREVEAVRAGLEGAVEACRSEGEPDAEKLLRDALARLSERALRPLFTYLERKAHWVVVPDGRLWLVPWSALLLPDGKYVVERYTVSHLITGRDLLPPREEDAGPKGGAPVRGFRSGPAVILADPDFDLGPGGKSDGAAPPPGAVRRAARLGDVRFGRLPGTAAEAKRIAPKLKRHAGAEPLLLTGPEASEAAFRRVKGPKVLVLATHGFFLPDAEANPLLRCGLALAGANRRAEAKPGEDDGILTGLEILETDLRGTELVVLSACETGLGEVRNGEGVAGLRQAFQLAGAQSVLATLWQIPDRQTAQLMGRFFDHLAKGQGKADALRLAQLETIRTRRQREGAAHPFYWAAFTLTGNWR